MANEIKNAIVLGGTAPHKALIENLKLRGYHTILVDYYENPPAKVSADEHIRESTLDKEKVLEIAQRANAALVISTSIDQANVTACYVAEKLQLPKPYSHEAALAVTNKLMMKRKMKENDIPTSDFVKVDSVRDIRNLKLKFPVVVKPADATGSKGVRKAKDLSMLESYLAEAFQVSRSGEAIIEEFFEGTEVQVDFFVQNKEVRLVMTREKVKVRGDGHSVLQSVGSIVPAKLSKEAYESILEVAKKIVRAFNLENTSLFIQAIVNKDKVNVIEFACRIGGGLSYSMIKIITGFDILDATVNTFLGVPTVIQYKHPEKLYSTNLIYTQPGIFGRISGYQKLVSEGIIEEFYFFKTKGMPIGPNMTSGDRVGGFLIKAEDRQSIFQKIDAAFRRLSVYDINGKDITRTDIIEELSNSYYDII